MDTNKLVVVEFLDKGEVVFCDEDVVSCLDEGGGGIPLPHKRQIGRASFVR